MSWRKWLILDYLEEKTAKSPPRKKNPVKKSSLRKCLSPVDLRNQESIHAGKAEGLIKPLKPALLRDIRKCFDKFLKLSVNYVFL